MKYPLPPSMEEKGLGRLSKAPGPVQVVRTEQ